MDQDQGALQPERRPKPTPTGSTGNGGDGTGAEDGGSQHPNPSDPGSSSERPPWWPDEIPFPPADNARRIRGRDIVLSPSTEAADDAGVYAFDTTSGAWVAPKDLSKPFRESTGPTPEPPVHENAPNRTGTIIGAILGSIALVAAVALSGWYVKRHRARKRYENLAHEARASGSARAFKLRPNVDDATDYNPSVINSHRNVVVPLLAPIPPDEGSRAAWRASQKAERAPSLSSLHLGLNFAHITLDRGSTSSDVGALPLRGESIFRRRTHSDHGQAEVAPRAEPEPELADITSLLHSQQPPAMAEVGYDLYKPTAAPPPPTPANLHSEAGMTDPNGNLLLTSQGYTLPEELMYMVVYPHLPRLSDEVELHPGDEVAVRKIYQDGWCRGTNLTTGYSGVFPLLAVEDVDPAAPAVESGLDYFDSYYGLHGNMDSVDKSSSSLGLNSLLLGANDPGYGADVQPRGPERVNTDDTIMAERIYENAANPADQKVPRDASGSYALSLTSSSFIRLM
ncbi:hypothetical protein BC832DRAFT_412349 [Gaertneriomyces semiglobifer]|nr:hypothetical protein BC832DRAFT_412349 [Gaertneriomyces semiglobifer]